MSNIYHILYKKPITDKYDMPRFLEFLTQQLVESGRIRIDADNKINFVRLNLLRLNTTLIFSYRELHDKQLLTKTKSLICQLLQQIYSKSQATKKTAAYIASMRKELTKYQFVNLELEMKLVRIFVQSAHPSVISNMLIDNTEIFLSYSYNIGDLLDIPNWKTQGMNSGMQSINHHNNSAIFVSCGGDPFGEWDGILIYGDGIPALARMMVIGGQEIGHYADIKKLLSNHITRYSCTYYPNYQANPQINNARLRDMDNLRSFQDTLHNMILFNHLAELEKSIEFYHKVKKKYLLRCYLQCTRKIKLYLFNLYIHNSDLDFILDYKHKRNTITLIIMALADMKYNLEPKSDAYKNINPHIEQAIICAEALARVPQQVNKWGHIVTQALTPNLYQSYYSVVIPDAIRYYEQVTGKKYENHDYRKCRGSLKETILYFYRKCSNFVKRKNPNKSFFIHS